MRAVTLGRRWEHRGYRKRKDRGNSGHQAWAQQKASRSARTSMDFSRNLGTVAQAPPDWMDPQTKLEECAQGKLAEGSTKHYSC